MTTNREPKAVPPPPRLGADADPKAWAYRLRTREQFGIRLSPVAREMWRAALGLPRDAKASQRINRSEKSTKLAAPMLATREETEA